MPVLLRVESSLSYYITSFLCVSDDSVVVFRYLTKNLQVIFAMSEKIVKDFHQLNINEKSSQKVKKTFAFSKPSFNGSLFYEKYWNAEFLKERKNIFSILAKYNELENFYNNLEANDFFIIDGILLKHNTPIVVKKSGLIDESDVDQDDFTLRRLAGLVAVYVNRTLTDFENIYSVQAESFGVNKPYSTTSGWDLNKKYYYGFKDYLSAVSGSEYFPDTFDYYPFIFALRRFQLKLISEEEIIHIGNIRHPTTQEPIATRCYRDYNNAQTTAKRIGFDLNKMLENVPLEIKRYFGKINN